VIASGKHHLENIVLNEDSGTCWGRFVGVHKNNSAIDERFADVYRFKDGKIKNRQSYSSAQPCNVAGYLNSRYWLSRRRELCRKSPLISAGAGLHIPMPEDMD
jgi:hypothetical protein